LRLVTFRSVFSQSKSNCIGLRIKLNKVFFILNLHYEDLIGAVGRIPKYKVELEYPD